MGEDRTPPRWINETEYKLANTPEEWARILQWRTTDHWAQFRDRNQLLPCEEEMQHYVGQLLPFELAYASDQGAVQWQKVHTLAVLVGLSPEPLLQSLCVYRPERLVLVLNEQYGRLTNQQHMSGHQVSGQIEDWAKNLLENLVFEPEFVRAEAKDQPDAVFRALRDTVLEDQRQGKEVVVDITGAKKSMVAGAFLFAAYANVPVSYVDFDDYDAGWRRPYGYTCRIGELPNPYRLFGLRDWERVRQLYEQGHFGGALTTLEELLPLMEAPRFGDEDRQAASNLKDVLCFYKAWADGDHRLALEILGQGLGVRLPGLPSPRAVTILGSDWPHAAEGADALSAAGELLRDHEQRLVQLFLSNPSLLAYAHDELAKVRRLLDSNEDNRSALLRAAGLDEFLLKARWVRLWKCRRVGDRIRLHWSNDEIREEVSIVTDDLRRALLPILIKHSDDYNMRRALWRRRIGDLQRAYVRLDLRRDRGIPETVRTGIYQLRPTPNAPVLGEYFPVPGLTDYLLGELRNQAIHTYLYVPYVVADAAYQIARANLKDLEDPEKGWLSVGIGSVAPDWSPQHVQHTKWKELRKECKLDFLPLISEEKGEEA